MTLYEAYKQGEAQLKNAAIPDANTDAWYLLEFVTGVSKAQYFMNQDRMLSESQREQYDEYIRLRATHIPLQHITGIQEFMGYEFIVNEHVLIPRQDTEVLLESVLPFLSPNMRVLDMCTGSGCILISLLKNVIELAGVGVDISEKALDIARQNAEKLDVHPTFLLSDLFDKVEGKFDVIVSNPPYIPTEVIEGLQEEVKSHDPWLALDGKEDGLYFYRRIVEDSVQYLNAGGRLCFEIGHDQGHAVKTLMEAAGFTDVTIKKDLAGLDRVVLGAYNI